MIKEVPIEIVREVEVVKSFDLDMLAKMMQNMDTVEVSKSVIGETVTAGEGKVVERREITDDNKRTKTTGTATKLTAKKAASKTSAKKAPAKKSSTKKASTKKVTAKKGGAKKSSKKDNLTRIEGIGPKIAGILHEGGIMTFEALSKTKVDKIQTLLDAAGPRYRMHNPGSWPKQSKLAAKGDWKALDKLQDELDGGK